jgi:hypothetical protein
MQLRGPIESLFSQLKYAVNTLTNAQYSASSDALFGATIGQHVRHIIELFIVLNGGYQSGIIEYDKRRRDLILEQNPAVAMKSNRMRFAAEFFM